MTGFPTNLQFSVCLLSQRSEPSGGTIPQVRCYMEYDDAWRGVQLRFLLYDEELFLHGKERDLMAGDPSDQLWMFGRGKNPTGRRPHLADWQLAPDVERATGVLASIDLTLGKKRPSTPADRRRFLPGKVWFVRPANVQQAAAQGESCQVALMMRHDNADLLRVAVLSFPVANTPHHQRRLLFRMALVGGVDKLSGRGVKEGDVVAATFTGENLARRPVIIDVVAAGASRSQRAGGDGGKLPPGTPGQDSRVSSPDYTGLYEAFLRKPEPGKIPPTALFVQLAQAGHALVGWFLQPNIVLTPR